MILQFLDEVRAKLFRSRRYLQDPRRDIFSGRSLNAQISLTLSYCFYVFLINHNVASSVSDLDRVIISDMISL